MTEKADAVRAYKRASEHPMLHVGELTHPERGTLEVVLKSVADAAVAALETKLAAAEQKWLDMEDDYIQTAGKLAAAKKRVRKLEKVARWCYDYIECDVDRPTFDEWLTARLTATEPKE